MKKLVLIVAAMLITFGGIAETKVTRKGNTFVVEATSNRKAEAPVNTDLIWEVGGQKYPIFISPSSGACFIIKVSKKTGKEYRQYLPKEVSVEIAKEMGITPKK